MLNEVPKVTKFDSKSIEEIFVGYSSMSKAYRVYIPTLWIIIESVHFKFDEITNFRVEKDHSIIGNGAENINAINKSHAIIVEDVQESPTT
jgi:hypothetical protein